MIREKTDRFKPLRDLGCVVELNTRILEGWSIAQLVEWLHDTQQELVDFSPQALGALLTAYRASFPSASFLGGRQSFLADVQEKAGEQLDVLAEYRKLYELQMQRIEIDHKLEQSFNKCMAPVTNDMDLARRILRDIADIQMDLGLHTRHLGVVGVDARVESHVQTVTGDSRVAAVLADPTKRQRMAGILRLMAKQADAEKAAKAAEPKSA